MAGKTGKTAVMEITEEEDLEEKAKEEEKKAVAVRGREGKVKFGIKISDF